MSNERMVMPHTQRISGLDTAPVPGPDKPSVRARKEFSRSVRVAAWKRTDGHCQACTRPCGPDARFDHIIADALGGQPTLENCQLICRWCHDAKTFGNDVPAIARAKRREARHLGIRQSRNPIRGWRKFDGTPVRNPRA